MKTTNIEWMKAKAEQLLLSQVEQIAKSEYPAGDLAEGMAEMAYGVGLINDTGLDYWRKSITAVAGFRRDELREMKCRALFEVPGMVNGELLNGQIPS